ncbi:MAG: hypothetical protein IJ880_17275 [Bacilli bacterium]|nr:hypothetical protein [Bacilli bacterium]
MTFDEKQVIVKREVAYEKAVNALIELVNAITDERDFYKNKCESYEEHSNS